MRRGRANVRDTSLSYARRVLEIAIKQWAIGNIEMTWTVREAKRQAC